MPINDYKESQIRGKILNKIKPRIQKGQSKHQKGYIYLNNILVTKVKIPNNHNRVMKSKKSQYIAKALKLEDGDFNALIDCPLTGPKYYEKLKIWNANLKY